MSEQGADELLVQRLINKDRGAFEFIFNEYYGHLLHYALRFLDTREEAEEVVQDVYVKFWNKCAELAPDSSIKSYLYRSVHNTCLNHLKHLKVRDAYKEYVIHHLSETAPEKIDEINPDKLREIIFEEVNKLPPRCAEIFKLSRMEGLKYQEIADHLNISIKTVEVQMGKALKILRDRLVQFKHL